MIKLSNKNLYKFSNWKEVKQEVLKAINNQNPDMSKEKAIDRLQPLPFLWYEDEQGNRYYPPEDPDESLKFMEEHMDGTKSQHLRMPYVTEDMITPDGTSFPMSTTINCIEPIVLYLINERQWDMVDAITIAASTCERCLNILLEDATGEVYTERDNWKENKNPHTHCEFCSVIDPEYDKWYKEEWEPNLKKKEDQVLLIEAENNSMYNIGDIILIIYDNVNCYIGKIEQYENEIIKGNFFNTLNPNDVKNIIYISTSNIYKLTRDNIDIDVIKLRYGYVAELKQNSYNYNGDAPILGRYIIINENSTSETIKEELWDQIENITNGSRNR